MIGKEDETMEDTKTILLVDDEYFFLEDFAESLSDAGYRILKATTVSEAKKIIENEQIDLAILDIMLPLGADLNSTDPDFLSAYGGFRSGKVLAAWIVKNYPRVKFVGFSAAINSEVIEWFHKYGAGFYHKHDMLPHELVARVALLLNAEDLPGLKSFIVHGHDNAAKYELKNYLQNTLGFPEPVILHEQPSLGRTIIEKFEAESSDVDLIFVLLTPDDRPAELGSVNELKRRARQNVILELGYFLGKMGRRSGRIILLHKGQLDIPSDISGLIYIDISNGIDAAGEAIRKEISRLLNLGSEAKIANKRMQQKARRR